MLRHLPNILTVARGFLITPALGLLFVWAFVAYYGFQPAPADYLPAYLSVPLLGLILTTVGWLSDGLDGYLAKTFDWKSAFGARVDPLMDKWFTYTGFLVVPLWYGLGWYLLWMIPLCGGIHWYSMAVTRMRKNKQILSANEWARRKSGVLFFAQFVMMAGMVYPPASTLSLWVACIATTAGAVLCFFAFDEYNTQICENERKMRAELGPLPKQPEQVPSDAPSAEIIPFKKDAA